jgi:hypothetical protein
MPEEVISDLDRTHRWALSGIYELPFGPGKALLAKSHPVATWMAAGWQLQSVWQSNTGQPIGFGNALLTGSLQSIPVGGAEQTMDRWFNTSAFNRLAAEQLVSNRRTLGTRFSGVRAPGFDTWDISAVKNFSLSERWRAQFRAEFLNALNRSNLVAPNTDPTNTLFGRITAVNGFPRYIHFGLKLIY